MQQNLLLMTDSYKFTHWRQYPPGTQKVPKVRVFLDFLVERFRPQPS